MKSARNMLVLSLVVSFSAMFLFAQWRQRPRTGSPQNLLEDRTNMWGMSGLLPALQAGFVDKAKNAQQKQAVIHVKVWGVHLVAPGSSNEVNNDKASLAYVLDHSPEYRTDQTEYTFRNLSPGHHTITVQLMALNNQPIGAKMILGLEIPK